MPRFTRSQTQDALHTVTATSRPFSQHLKKWSLSASFSVSGSKRRSRIHWYSWTQRAGGSSGQSRLISSHLSRLFIFSVNKCGVCWCLFQGFSGPVGPVGMIGPVGKPVSLLMLYFYFCGHDIRVISGITVMPDECQIKDVSAGFSGCQRTQRKPWRDGKMCSSRIAALFSLLPDHETSSGAFCSYNEISVCSCATVV